MSDEVKRANGTPAPAPSLSIHEWARNEPVPPCRHEYYTRGRDKVRGSFKLCASLHCRKISFDGTNWENR